MYRAWVVLERDRHCAQTQATFRPGATIWA